jgi:adenosine deaminase
MLTAASLSPDIERLIVAIPKVELHVHLEGSVQPSTFLKLARKNNLDIQCDDEAAVAELFRFKDFAHFMDLYGACTYAFRDPDDFELVTTELGLNAARQGVRYMEVTFTAGTHFRFKGVPFDEQIDAIARGASRVRKSTGTEMRFIIDHVRGFSLDDCYQTAQWCIDGRDRGIVALGLGGFEDGRPASLYSDAIHWAQQQGVPFVPHAGEAAGPESMWDALQFDPPRLGHGFRAIEDSRLVAYLRDHRVLLEICPTSNACTGTISSLDQHPVRRLWDLGVLLTLNTDDPSMFNTSMLNEHRLAVSMFGFTVDELAEMAILGVRSALLPPAQRFTLEETFRREFKELGLAV